MFILVLIKNQQYIAMDAHTLREEVVRPPPIILKEQAIYNL